MIELASTVETTRFVDPAGAPVEQTIEHRVDPLTGSVASINGALGEKAKLFLGTPDLALLRDLEEKSRAGCPFCAASERGTRYPPALVAEGQLRVGTALAMPNLFSKCASDSVVVLDPARHVLSPSAIGAEAFASGVRAAAELVRRLRRSDASLVHHLAGMNFLHPGGSSVPHPHFQVHVRGLPYSGLARLLEASAAWRAARGHAFWPALVASERATGARFVGRTGRVEWLAAWAPAHQKEVWGVLCDVSTLADLDDEQARALGDGIARVVSSYEASGSHPFTLAFLSAPAPVRDGSFALQVRICSRPAFRSLYANYDTWFAPKFVGDDVHTEPPEVLAAQLRSRFDGP